MSIVSYSLHPLLKPVYASSSIPTFENVDTFLTSSHVHPLLLVNNFYIVGEFLTLITLETFYPVLTFYLVMTSAT